MNCSTILFVKNSKSVVVFQISKFISPMKYSLSQSRTQVRNDSLLCKITLSVSFIMFRRVHRSTLNKGDWRKK